MNYELITLPIAYLLDLAIGDPPWQWHPVRLIGRLIQGLEEKLNRDNFRYDKIYAGIILIILVVGITVFFVWVSLCLAKFIHPVFYYSYTAVLIYFSLSVRALAEEVRKIYRSLKNTDIQSARRELSLIVGRDTDKLTEKEIIRATVETVAESTMDGIVAPLFYAFLGGALLAWVYKAINTLDSMVGYRSERFVEFGRPSAKLDGWVNFIPAKITSLLISGASCLCGRDGLNSLRWVGRYFFKGQENNSIATEAAMAGALKVQLGGLNFYNSVPILKPLVGHSREPLEIKHIRQSMDIAYLCSFLFLLIGLFYLSIRRR